MTDRDKFLESVRRKMLLLNHAPSEWKFDRVYSCRCELCGQVITVKLNLRLSDLNEDEPCKGKIIPSPGKVGGPCDRPCGHLGCHNLFQIAATTCSKCARPIGFDVEFIRDDNGKLHHVLCPSFGGEK